MDDHTCAACGATNNFVDEFCTACGAMLIPDTLSALPTTAKLSTDSERDFGFGVGTLEFAKEGVSPSAAQYLKERFKPVSPISKGGMGKIFLVQELLSGRFVALKVMLEKAANDTSLVQQFMREAVITARLEHPHIIPVHELGFLTEGQLYYTMRYVQGNTLDQIVHDVGLEERLRILRSAATAVNYAHEEGLWHRDLKPHNILVGDLGDTYVIDWGLVTVQPGHKYQLVLPRMVAERHLVVMPDNLLDVTREAVSTITGREGRIVGTPPYMSPEQIVGEDYLMGRVSDIWAFGIMLFEALTGRHPIENGLAMTPHQILDRIVHTGLPSPTDLVSDIPEVLDSLCRRMLQTDPHQRMQSLKAFIETLTQFLKATGKTIADFSTFSKLSHDNSELATTWKQGLSANSESERMQKKLEILIEIAQLGLFSSRRRKELWRELSRL